MLLIKTCPWWHYTPEALTLDIRDLRAFFLRTLSHVSSGPKMVSNCLHFAENADCFCPLVFDLFSSNCWQRLCGLSLFSSSWLLWGWTTRLMNNMNVSILLSFVPVKREKTHLLWCVYTMHHLSCFVAFSSLHDIGKLNGYHVLHAKQLF